MALGCEYQKWRHRHHHDHPQDYSRRSSSRELLTTPWFIHCQYRNWDMCVKCEVSSPLQAKFTVSFSEHLQKVGLYTSGDFTNDHHWLVSLLKQYPSVFSLSCFTNAGVFTWNVTSPVLSSLLSCFSSLQFYYHSAIRFVHSLSWVFALCL